jgi:hypothetical protein
MRAAKNTIRLNLTGNRKKDSIYRSTVPTPYINLTPITTVTITT